MHQDKFNLSNRSNNEILMGKSYFTRVHFPSILRTINSGKLDFRRTKEFWQNQNIFGVKTLNY